MKINYDCIRSLLLFLEEELQFDEELSYPETYFENACNSLPQFTPQEIAYSTLILKEANYAEITILEADDQFCGALYSRITLAGHQYLDSIRSNTVWDKLKKKLHDEGLSFTFGVIKGAAETLLLSRFLP